MLLSSRGVTTWPLWEVQNNSTRKWNLYSLINQVRLKLKLQVLSTQFQYLRGGQLVRSEAVEEQSSPGHLKPDRAGSHIRGLVA